MYYVVEKDWQKSSFFCARHFSTQKRRRRIGRRTKRERRRREKKGEEESDMPAAGDEEDECAGDETTGLLSGDGKTKEEEENHHASDDVLKTIQKTKTKEEEEEDHASSTTPSVIRATQTFYPNVVEDDDENDDENCAVGVPVLADGSIDFSAYERGQHPPRHSSSSSTTRDYARALAESEGNQDVSVLLEEDSSTTSSSRTHVNSPNVVELQSYSTGLFDCALDPLNFLKNFFCIPCGVGEYARDTAQGECFPTALSITLGNFLLNNLCFPMGCFATASCIHSSNAVAEHRLGIHDRTDLATVLCCAPCVVSRMQREIEARKALGVMPSREELMLRFPNELDDWNSLHHGRIGDNYPMNRRDFVAPRRVRMVHRRGTMVGGRL